MRKLKHCHFQICFNELPFLIEKVPFLYRHFDQLIFYDLCVTCRPYRNSDDGSLEFLRNYPDPDGKILVLADPDIDGVRTDIGASVVGKRQMFVIGSRFVRDDIDVFWCSDADEFFTAEAFGEVNSYFSSNDSCMSFDFPHYVFFKDLDHIFCGPTPTDDGMRLEWGRIARHRKGNIYGHCTLASQYKPTFFDPRLRYFHFAYVGESRVRYKLTYLPGRSDYIEQCWNADLSGVTANEVFGLDLGMHPNPSIRKGVRKLGTSLPEYINKQRLLRALSDSSTEGVASASDTGEENQA
jgi:hypothetical protein